MSIKWKLPIIILAAFLCNIIILSIFYRFYLSDKVNERITISQHNAEETVQGIAEVINNKNLNYAIDTLKDIASVKNVTIKLKKLGSDEEYIFTSKEDDSGTFSASREVTLNNSFYMLTVRKITNLHNLRNLDIVKDILYFELFIVFLMLLIMALVLYLNYTKPLVGLSNDIKQYKNVKTARGEVPERMSLDNFKAPFMPLWIL